MQRKALPWLRLPSSEGRAGFLTAVLQTRNSRLPTTILWYFQYSTFYSAKYLPGTYRASTRASSTPTRPRTSPAFESLTRLFSVKINLFLLWTQISNFGHFGHFDFVHKSTRNPGAMPQLWHLTLATCPQPQSGRRRRRHPKDNTH